MALDLITGHQGVAHISAEQISDINKAMMNGYGDNKVMRMSGGAITQNALTLEIATGYWRANGFDIQIQESETHYIDPSTIGTSRIDNIYVELLQDIPTGAQRAEITIIMGEEAASPVTPEDPTEPYLNTDILLDAVQIGTVTVTEGAMVFTDLTEAYDLVTPSELAAVQTLATNALGMIQDDSDAYSSSKAYAVDDLCIHDDKVYKCITACSPAAWSVNQNCFEETTLLKVNSTLKDALNECFYSKGQYSIGFTSAETASGSTGIPGGFVHLPKLIPTDANVTINTAVINGCWKYDGTSVPQTTATSNYDRSRNCITVIGNAFVGYHVITVISATVTFTIN